MIELLSIEEVRTIAGFKELQEAWDDLVERTEAPNLSNSFLFSYSWWKNRSNDKQQLFILLLKEHEKLVGIAPLSITEVTWKMFKARKVSFMLPRYLQCDFIAESDHHREFIEQIVDHSLRATNCNYLEFCGIPEESRSFRLVWELAQKKGMIFYREFHSAGCYIPVQGTWDSFMRSKSRSFRKSGRYYENRLMRKGRLEMTRVRNTRDPAELLKKMLRVDATSWKASWASQPSNGGLISDLLIGCNEKGWLDVFFEEIDGVPISYLFLIHYRGKAYAMFTSYNLSYESDSPGIVSFGHTLKEIFKEQEVAEVDFLSSYEYLRRWTNLLHNRHLITLYPPGLTGSMLKLSRNVIKKTRSMFDQRDPLRARG